MSRMVRDSEGAGLRERLYFARLLLDELDDATARQEGRARLLALRGAVLNHLYAVPVGLMRRAAARYQVSGTETLISLQALTQAFDQAGVEAPEARLVEQARQTGSDPLAWLDGEVLASFDTPALGLRPEPPREDDGLALRAEDPDELLGPGDLGRLRECLERLDRLRRDCEPHAEEW